jgi:hypothetical protein
MATKIGNNGDEPDEGIKPMVVGHLLVRDKTTGEVLLNQRDNLVHQVSLKGDVDAAD